MLPRRREVASADLELSLDVEKPEPGRPFALQGLVNHPAALLPIPELEECPGQGGGQVAAHRPFQPQLAGGCEPAPVDVEGFSVLASARQDGAQVEVGSGDALGVADLLCDAASRN